MGFFSYLKESSNLITPEAVITNAYIDSDFPALNLANLPASKPCLIDRLTSQKLLITLPIASAFTVFALVNHNLTSAATITLKAGSSYDPDGSQFQTTITWTRRTAFKIFTQQTYKYLSLTISDPTNRDGFLKIGLLRCGVLTVQDFVFNFGWAPTRRFEAVRPASEFGTPFVSPLFDQMFYSMQFDPLTAAQANTISDLLADLKGDGTPLLVVPVSSAQEAQFGRFITDDQQIRNRNSWQSMVLQFREDGSGRVAVQDPAFSYIAGDSLTDLAAVFARASAALRVEGTLKFDSIAINSERDDHYPNSFSRTLLLEASSINNWSVSEDLDDALWTKVNSSVTANAIAAPAESDTKFDDADKIVENATASAAHGIERNITGATSNKVQAIRICAAPGSRTWLYIETTDKAGTVTRTWVNLATGVLGTANHTARVRSLSGSFTEIEILFNVGTGATTPKVRFGMATGNGNVTYSGDGASGLYLWGAQWENDVTALSSYIPTSTVAVTRSADSLYIPLSETPKALTIYARFVERGSIGMANAGILFLGNAGATGALLSIHSTGTYYRAVLDDGAGTTSTSTMAAAPSVGDEVELRVTIAEDGTIQISQTINGGSEVSATAGSTMNLPAAFADDRIYFNSRGSSNTGLLALAAAKILRGTQTLATMRTA